VLVLVVGCGSASPRASTPPPTSVACPEASASALWHAMGHDGDASEHAQVVMTELDGVAPSEAVIAWSAPASTEDETSDEVTGTLVVLSCQSGAWRAIETRDDYDSDDDGDSAGSPAGFDPLVVSRWTAADRDVVQVTWTSTFSARRATTTLDVIALTDARVETVFSCTVSSSLSDWNNASSMTREIEDDHAIPARLHVTEEASWGPASDEADTSDPVVRAPGESSSVGDYVYDAAAHRYRAVDADPCAHGSDPP
jgi:hypothetical protein